MSGEKITVDGDGPGWGNTILKLAIPATIIAFTLGSCGALVSSLRSCGGPPSRETRYVDIGTVKVGDEVCSLQEVREYAYNQMVAGTGWTLYEEFDSDRWCRASTQERILLRRMTCPSGKTMENTVDVDGTKFHREVLR